MSFQDFDFALFIKDESVPDGELKSRTVLYQGKFTAWMRLYRRSVWLIRFDAEKDSGFDSVFLETFCSDNSCTYFLNVLNGFHRSFEVRESHQMILLKNRSTNRLSIRTYSWKRLLKKFCKQRKDRVVLYGYFNKQSFLCGSRLFYRKVCLTVITSVLYVSICPRRVLYTTRYWTGKSLEVTHFKQWSNRVLHTWSCRRWVHHV